VDIENNLVYNVSASGLQSTWGPNVPGTNKPNTINNNIFAYFGISAIMRNQQETISPEVPSLIFSRNLVEFDNGLQYLNAQYNITRYMYPNILGTGHGWLCDQGLSVSGIGICSGDGATSVFNFQNNAYVYTGIGGVDSLTDKSSDPEPAFFTNAANAQPHGYAFSGDPAGYNWQGSGSTDANEDNFANGLGTTTGTQSLFADVTCSDGRAATSFATLSSYGTAAENATLFSPWLGITSEQAGSSFTPPAAFNTNFPLVPLDCSSY
jgi:hypothetical protein